MSKFGASELGYGHGRVCLGRREDLVFIQMREKRALSAETRHLGQDLKPKIAALELSLAEIAPLGEGDRVSAAGAHTQSIAVNEILGQDVRSRSIDVLGLVKIEVVREDLQH